MRIIENKVQCRKCKSIIESEHTRHLVYCVCRAVYLDGGREYQRIGWPAGEKMDDWVDCSYSKYGNIKK